MRISIFLLLSCGMLLLQSCANYSLIRVEDVKGQEVALNDNGHLVAALEMKINNPTWRNVSVQQVELVVYRHGKLFATLNSAQRLKIPSHSNGYLPFPVVIRMQNLLAAVLVLGEVRAEDFEIEGHMRATVFPFSKTIRVQRQSLETFTREYGDVVTPILNVKK